MCLWGIETVPEVKIAAQYKNRSVWSLLGQNLNLFNNATQDEDWDDDPHRFFIFNNEAALKKIRWRHFLSDCKPLMDNFSVVTEQLDLEINSAKAFLTENHQDILANFDPNIVKLHKNLNP